MRVDTTNPTGDDEQGSGEQGAVAVVVAVSLIVLLGLSAFAVDFGLAYSETRQVQTAADAAAVASASAYAEQPGSCTTILSTLGTGVGEAAGRAVFKQNHDTVDRTPEIRCESGVLRARWTARETTDTTLARAMPGAPDQLISERTAEAVLGIPATFGEGMRPFALCSVDLPVATEAMPTRIRRTSGAVNGSSSADPRCPEPNGNWWTMTCPAPGNARGNSALIAGITNGCEWPVAPVQPAGAWPPTRAELLGACPPADDPVIPEDCLEADPGDFATSVANAWKPLITNEVEFQLPVFCGKPTCDPIAYNANPGGRPVSYPILAIVTVQMCGYHLGGNEFTFSGPTGPCSASNMPIPALDITDGDNQDRYFWLVYKRINYTNTVTPSKCKLGDACDVGARSVFMVD